MNYLFLMVSLVLVSGLSAQTETPPVYYGASAMPPSPTAASLGKYGDVPVSLFTGVPEISIPFYSVSEGNLSVPISLSYHSQGFKVEDVASWVGLGWSLNAGGMITRSVKGVPDDFDGDNWGAEYVASSINQSSYGFLSTGTSVETLYNSPPASQTSGVADNDMLALSNELKDGTPDIFYFNFPGGSGQFMFDKNGTIRFLSQQNYKITYNRNGSGDLVKFEITDGNGNIYTFDQIETTKSRSFNTQGTAVVSSVTDAYLSSVLSAGDNYVDHGVYNSSWYLSKIKNATGDHEINFAYTTENQRNYSGFSLEYAYINGSGNTVQYDNTQQQYSYNMLENSVKRLTEINWSKGKIEFGATITRNDINDGSSYQSSAPMVQSNALSSITIKDNANFSLKRFVFAYSYFIAPNAVYNISMYQKLKLLSVTEQNNDFTLSNPPYTFEYEETVPIAPRFSQRQDYWGYLKAATPAYNEYTPKVYLYPNDAIDNDFLSEFSIYPRATHSGELVFGNYDRAPEASSIKTGILKKITYPTGGYTAFEFEPHQFYLMGQNRTGGGLRIKKITDNDGNISVVKNFSYTQPASPSVSSGKVLTLPVFAKRPMCTSNNSVRLSNNSIAPLGSTMGSHVAYTDVTVEYNGNGKTVSTFDFPAAVGSDQEDCTGGSCIYNRTHSGKYYYQWYGAWAMGCYDKTNFPFADNPNYDWSRGALQEEKVYDNQDRLVQKTVNEYTIKDYQKIYAFTNKSLMRVIWNPGTAFEHSDIMFKYAQHYYLSAWKVLSRQTVTRYDINNVASLFVNATNYSYDNAQHKLPTKIKTTDSKGQDHESIMSRCTDFNMTTGFLATLNTENRLNEVIEQQEWIYDPGNSTKKLLSAGFTEYKDYAFQNGNLSPQVLPYKQYQFETAAPAPSSGVTATGFTSGGSFTLDSRYRPLGEYSYDGKDNLTGSSAYNNSLKINSTTIYGHGKSLAIAKVSNASETDCGFTSFESDDIGPWTLPAGVTITSDAHCGKWCCSVPPLTNGPTRNYVPATDKQDKKFILSCWVKTNSAAAGTVGSLLLYTVQSALGTVVYPNVSGASMTVPVMNTNNKWRYIEVEIDLKLVKANGGLSASTPLALRNYLQNTNASVTILIDDLRFYPKESRMASYTYVPQTGASSVSDENSNCRLYEYDTFGRLKLVRDQNGKILEKTEYNYKP